jgi:wobble nucleotide-excising tRNase
MARKHECEELNKNIGTAVGKIDGSPTFGCLITAIEYTEEKGWVAHNCEYASMISYCPFCGKKLEK